MRKTVLIALVALAGCASAQRTLTYPATWPDADITVGTHRYQAWFHERDATLLLQRGPPMQLARMLAENSTRYAADRSETEPVWRAAADAVLQPMGCHATEITGADQMREVNYACAGTVEIGAEVAARRPDWQRGVRVDDPSVAASPQRY